MPRFDDKVVLITGGSRGIGRGIVNAFLDSGARVFACARHVPEERAPEGPPSSEADDSAEFIEADVRDADQVQRLIDAVLDRAGRLDILVNNAGGSPAADAATFTEAIIRLNLLAPLLVSQKAHPALKAAKGSIINIASVSGIRPSPGTVAYGAAKAGLLSATASLAQEWGPEVRVNAIVAGLIKTSAAAADEHYGGEQGLAAIEDKLPAKRMGTAEDIANACLYLASDAAAYVSGASLEVFGGGEPPSFLTFVSESMMRPQR
ncbi:MAG: SDR family oxidoreductase [Gammaproteobacteria bacterium]|nr:SDR family oxidoreductase [Gammaproteobacteria bacterium]